MTRNDLLAVVLICLTLLAAIAQVNHYHAWKIKTLIDSGYQQEVVPGVNYPIWTK